MNRQEKQARLKELSKPNAILSDQELEERDFLEADLKEMDKDQIFVIDDLNYQWDKMTDKQKATYKEMIAKTKTEQTIENNKKTRRTLFEVIKDKYKKEPTKPVTNADIDQLKKEVQAAELRKKLAELQASTPKKTHPVIKILRALAENETNAKKKKGPSFTI